MPVLIAAFWGALASIMASLVGRVLLALGIGYVTYQGLDTLMGFTLTQVKNAMGQLPGEVVSFIAYLWVDKAVSMVFSAYLAALAVRGVANGAVTRMKIK